MSSPKHSELVRSDVESGYGSGESNASIPDVFFSKPHLKFVNLQLQKLGPEDILRWAITTLPQLYQTTAFGQTGLVILDMLSKLPAPFDSHVDAIFLDTLHHFSETLSLVDSVKKRYPRVNFHIYKPEGCETTSDFYLKYGERLWESNEELYDFTAKVEPAQRAYAELQVRAVLTGRRKTQGGRRGEIDIVEVDETGLVKVNPLANWSLAQVREYIQKNSIPYNVLLDRGYKSVGDWHSTQPVRDGDCERAGRWKGRQKSECGIHNPKSKYAQFLMNQEQKRQLEALEEELEMKWGIWCE